MLYDIYYYYYIETTCNYYNNKSKHTSLGWYHFTLYYVKRKFWKSYLRSTTYSITTYNNFEDKDCKMDMEKGNNCQLVFKLSANSMNPEILFVLFSLLSLNAFFSPANFVGVCGHIRLIHLASDYFGPHWEEQNYKQMKNPVNITQNLVHILHESGGTRTFFEDLTI